MMGSKINKALHKWLSLLVGLQLIIWLVTGLYFNLMDHHLANGHEFRAHSHKKNSSLELELFPVSQISAPEPQQVKLLWLFTHPYYHFIYEMGAHSYQKKKAELFDAITGKPFSLSESEAKNLARDSYSGPGRIVEAKLLQPPFDDYVSQQNPMWQVTIEDKNNTTIYLDDTTGQVLRHVNDDSRLKTLMMKLHFMDYGNSGGFNHWLIILFAFATLLLSVTGVTWLVEQYKNGMLNISFANKRRVIGVTFVNSNTECDIDVNSHETVLDGLNRAHIYLPSACGGGGTCGKCMFKTVGNLPITAAESEQISNDKITKGYRLACQHKMKELQTIEVETSQRITQHELVVTATRFITPFIKEIRFRPKSNKALQFKAGAYMEFDIPAGKSHSLPDDLPAKFEHHWKNIKQSSFNHQGAVRHYSLVNFDQETDELVFNVRWQVEFGGERAGIGSVYLSSLQVGDSVTARGPFSDFFAKEQSVESGAEPVCDSLQRIFIGGGSGLAPLRSIIFEQLEKYSYQGQMTLVYGARTEDDLLYKTSFEQLEKKYTNFRYLPTLSSPTEKWSGRKGYVQHVLSELLAEYAHLEDKEFYLCGPMAMMVEVERDLLKLGVSDEQIFKDSFNR